MKIDYEIKEEDTHKPFKNEWADEPDFLELKLNGFDCFIKRIEGVGHLCGYVKIPKDNKYYNIKYNDIPISCHGGLTYSGIQGEDWVIGFDCAHFNDCIPNYIRQFPGRHATYKNIAYVTKELESITKQLSEQGESKDEN